MIKTRIELLECDRLLRKFKELLENGWLFVNPKIKINLENQYSKVSFSILGLCVVRNLHLMLGYSQAEAIDITINTTYEYLQLLPKIVEKYIEE